MKCLATCISIVYVFERGKSFTLSPRRLGRRNVRGEALYNSEAGQSCLRRGSFSTIRRPIVVLWAKNRRIVNQAGDFAARTVSAAQPPRPPRRNRQSLRAMLEACCNQPLLVAGTGSTASVRVPLPVERWPERTTEGPRCTLRREKGREGSSAVGKCEPCAPEWRGLIS